MVRAFAMVSAYPWRISQADVSVRRRGGNAGVAAAAGAAKSEPGKQFTLDDLDHLPSGLP
jgi:hypothetical protein